MPDGDNNYDCLHAVPLFVSRHCEVPALSTKTAQKLVEGDCDCHDTTGVSANTYYTKG